MPTVWFCCQCRSGPYNPYISSRCGCSEHDKCDYCREEPTPTEHSVYRTANIGMNPCDGINALPLPVFKFDGADTAMPIAMSDDEPIALPASCDPKPFVNSRSDCSNAILGHRFTGVIRHHGHQGGDHHGHYSQSGHGHCGGSNNGHYGGDGSHQRPEDGGEREYRWYCCACGSDNSVRFDAGCPVCNNHWRERCCTVYEVIRK